MKTSVQMAIMSRLSDLAYISDPVLLNNETNFIKFLIMKYPNTTVEVSYDELDKLYNDFKNR